MQGRKSRKSAANSGGKRNKCGLCGGDLVYVDYIVSTLHRYQCMECGHGWCLGWPARETNKDVGSIEWTSGNNAGVTARVVMP